MLPSLTIFMSLFLSSFPPLNELYLNDCYEELLNSNLDEYGFLGHGECTTPASTMESCTQESRLILRYQACPDVYGSESAGMSSVFVY